MRKVDPVRHEQKRREILAAAETCFAVKGFHGASTAEICRAAGISAGHLYHYFESKEAIIAALAELRLGAALETMERLLAGPDSLDRFLEIFCTLAPMESPDRGHLLLELLAEASRNPAIASMMRGQGDRARQVLADLVVQGQAASRIDPALDPQLAASLLIAVVIDATKALVIRQPGISRDAASAMIRLLVVRFLTGGALNAA